MADNDRLELEEAVEALGGVKDEFRPHAANIVAARIIGSIAAVAGGTVAFYVLRDADFSPPRVIALGTSTLIVFSGVWAWIRSLRWSTQRLFICRDGVVETKRGQIQTCRWNEVEKIVQFEKREVHLPTLLAPVRWTIYYPPQKQITFDRDSSA